MSPSSKDAAGRSRSCGFYPHVERSKVLGEVAKAEPGEPIGGLDEEYFEAMSFSQAEYVPETAPFVIESRRLSAAPLEA